MKISTIGERIKELRCEKGLSQLEFSDKLNISNTTLSMYESNKRIPSDDIKEKIASYFDVSIDYLMCRTNQRNIVSKEQLDHDEFMENMFSQVLVKLRKENALSQKALAEKIGVSQQTVGSWETMRTEPDQRSLKLLADYFNVSLDYLLGQPIQNSILKNRLRLLRQEKELTQKELANIFSISDARYNQYETGRRTPDYMLLNHFADYFGVSLDYLLGRTNKKQQQEHDNFMEAMEIHFMNASEKDRDAIYRKISELYWDAKEKYDNQNK